MMMNLNEPKELHQRVRESPDLLAGIIGSAMDAIIAIDDAQRIVLFNTAAEKIFTCTANEAVGTSVERFVPQRFRDGHSTRVRRFAESGVTNRSLNGLGTLWGLRATGEEFPIEAAISKIESDGKKFFTVVIRDITERHRAEEAVRESEQRFRLIADTAPVLMWMSGTDKLCTYFNKPWSDFTGRAMEAELGNGWAEGVHPQDLQRCIQTYVQSFDRREEFRMEYRLRRHDGEYRWIFDIGVPRFDQDHSFVGYIGICVDVTERRRAEEARIRSAAIVESSDDAIVGTDTSGTVTDWNKGAERLFGYLASEAIGRHISFLAATDHPDDGQGILKKAMNGDVVKHYETVRQRKDGTRVDVSLTVSPIVDAEGRFVGASGIARDITERKQAEEALRKSEERFRMAAQAGRMFAYEWDVATDVIVRSPEAAKIVGMEETAQITGQQILARVHPDDRERLIAAVTALSPDKPDLKISYRIERPDGTVIWVDRNSRAYFDEQGGMLRVVGMVVDITERKLAEEMLRRSEERLRLAQKVARIGTFEWNIETGVNIWTPELEAMYGLAPGSFDKTQTSFETLVHPDDRGRVIEWVDDALKTGRPNTGEWRVIWPDGSLHWIAGRWQAFMSQSGEAVRMIGVNMDVTDQKRAQEEIAGMTRKLVEAQEQERARIARELHDDINQRVALLSIELDELRLKRDDLPTGVRARMDGLQLLASDISTDLHALSHELHSSKLDHLGIVRAMTSWCKEFGDRQKLKIDFKSRHVPKLSQEISICLFRVLQEAAYNAVKHSGAKRIEVQLVENSGEIHLNVSDSGKGFDIEAAGQSHGLGLTSMRERVRLVGGTIAIESEPTGGTKIHVRVPLESEQGTQPRVKAQVV
jgi:PAS domain S-box-containing protein